MKKTQTVLLCALLLTSILFVALPTTTDAGDFPEENVPDPPGDPTSPPNLSGFGVDYETGWNDTTFSFWLNFSSNEQPNNIIVQVNVDSVAYDMFENDTKDDDYSDGKDYFWMNENRLWSKGLIPYFFYTEINDTSNTTDTSYFEIYNRAPYMLEPPLTQIYVGEELEWEGRATDEDLDSLTWTIDSNITEDDVDEFEWETVNYSFKLKIKCNQPFVRWINLSATDPYDNNAYWRWELYCVEDTTQDSPDLPRRDREEPDPTERDDIRLFGEGEADPRPTADHNTDYAWCGSDCGGDGYQWDDENNWRNTATWTVGGYPEGNDDTASFNETADSLYLKHGANSVVTIGALTTTSGFTGTITFSIDLIIDDAGGKNGSLNHKAVATIDVNTSNEQINFDGNLYISSASTLTERSGIFIVQGAKTQVLRVQSTNKLYKLTTDTASTVGELYDNLTAFQITIGTGTTYKADANTRGYELWTNFTDAATCGFVSTSAGTLNLLGTNAGPQANITTADASPPPTTYWVSSATGLTIIADYATFDYYGSGTRIYASSDIENSTFDHGKTIILNVGTIVSFRNVIIQNYIGSYGIYPAGTTGYTDFDNIQISGSGSNDIYTIVTRVELQNSNFDTSKTDPGTSGNIISSVHNDIANAYKIMATTLSKSTITNKHDSGDKVDLISGKYILDEDSAAKWIMAQDGTTLVLGKDVADASITLTFDDTNWAGFANDVANMGGKFAGKFYANGTTTYPHTIRATNLPATTGWRGIDSLWPATGKEHMVHNVTMYNTRAWHTGHEALAQYSNVTFDATNVAVAGTGQFTIWEPTTGSFFNDIDVNGTGGAGEDAIFIMPDSVHVFLKNFVVTNFSGDDQVEIDEGTTGEVVHFRNSNFDETDMDFDGGVCHWISQDHQDTSGRYLIGVHAGSNSSKSYVASGWDFTASDTVELIEGVLTIDENADATSFFIEETDAGIEVLTGYTFDLTTNLTNNGTLINNGTITDSAGYFNFYNTNPGGMWFNNSTVSKAKLAYYYGGFNFTIGMDANSTINEWTLEAPSGIDTAFNITYYDFNNKGSGVIWHLNATAASGSVYFGTDNLTANERYDSYVDLILYGEHTADAGGWVNFSYDGWSTRHIYLTWVVGGPIPDIPGPGQWDSWKVGFSYSKHPFTNEVRLTAIFRYDHNASWYIWDFDGVIYESASPNLTRNFAFAFYSTESVKLTIVATDGNRYWMESPITLDNSLWIALLCLTLISLGAVTIMRTRRARTKTELIMVEVEG